jgi:hypothetical protein
MVGLTHHRSGYCGFLFFLHNRPAPPPPPPYPLSDTESRMVGLTHHRTGTSGFLVLLHNLPGRKALQPYTLSDIPGEENLRLTTIFMTQPLAITFSNSAECA